MPFIASGVWPTMPRPFLSFLSLFTNVVEEEFSEVGFPFYGVLGSSPGIFFLVTVVVTLRRRASGRVLLLWQKGQANRIEESVG